MELWMGREHLGPPRTSQAGSEQPLRVGELAAELMALPAAPASSSPLGSCSSSRPPTTPQ